MDSYLSNGDGAWFKQNLVAWESGAYTDAPYSQYHQFVATPYDPVWGTPDGIGLMQLEPPNRRSGHSDFWVTSPMVRPTTPMSVALRSTYF